MAEDRKGHWNSVYDRKSEAELSWHQDEATISLELTSLAGVTAASSIIDIGGGTSPYVRGVVAMGVQDVTVLDLSHVALDAARARLGHTGEAVAWLVADVTRWTPARQYDLWHDRAVFHFLIDVSERDAYLNNLSEALHVGGHAIIATFAPDGPEMCSGLPVERYNPSDLADVLGTRFELVAERHHLHRTPSGKDQSFQFSLFRKLR